MIFEDKFLATLWGIITIFDALYLLDSGICNTPVPRVVILCAGGIILLFGIKVLLYGINGD